MNLPVRETIDEIGAAKLARAMGLPLSTLWHWRTDNKIPGKAGTYEMRARQFVEGVKKARAAKPKKASRT